MLQSLNEFGQRKVCFTNIKISYIMKIIKTKLKTAKYRKHRVQKNRLTKRQ